MKDEAKRAALFMTGGSQAVRLPKEFRFEGNAVRIWREGKRVILEPIEKATWPDGFWERLAELGPLSDDFDIGPPLPESPHRDDVLREFERERD
ncbi:MAG: antitoxin [Gemmatimonadota bacterium]